YQQITIPSGASPTLTFYLNVTSAETTTSTQYDKLFVELRSTSGALLKTLATYSNLNKTASSTSYTLRSLSLAGYSGQTVRVQFRVSTDSSSITTFRVDTASAK
ncbi:MAG: serine protease, partial [Blastocatellia bacterium]